MPTDHDAMVREAAARMARMANKPKPFGGGPPPGALDLDALPDSARLTERRGLRSSNVSTPHVSATGVWIDVTLSSSHR